jgi:hypothetical protein
MKDLSGQTSVEVTLIFPVFVNLTGLSYSEIVLTRFDIREEYDPFYTMFFMKKGTELVHRHLIRSAVIKVSSSVHDPYKIYDEPIRLKFRMNPITTFSSRFNADMMKGMYCLAKLVNNKWICVERKNKVIRSNSIKEYDIFSDGTYCVIISPEFVSVIRIFPK